MSKSWKTHFGIVILTPLLIPFGLPTLGGHWFLFFEILLGGHGENKLTNFHHTKSPINIFHKVQCFFQYGMTPMINDELRFYYPLHILSCLNMYNCTNCYFMKTSLLSLVKCQLLVHGMRNIIFFLLEILSLLHLISMNAPILQFQKLEN